jgi:hypothetical protein
MSAMVEVLLDAGDPIVIAEAYKHDFFKDSYDVWWESRDAQQDTVSATVWCLKAIRANGADGLEEEVCKRMQCVSVWDYEPKIKRGRFFKKSLLLGICPSFIFTKEVHANGDDRQRRVDRGM